MRAHHHAESSSARSPADRVEGLPPTRSTRAGLPFEGICGASAALERGFARTDVSTFALRVMSHRSCSWELRRPAVARAEPSLECCSRVVILVVAARVFV
mmetsp:Transcript_13153/g.39185  ORF Transcript_13153/g.39185 Transcript_13153/m.39185 type:complete len:100 (+) Transcript_13153:308-607(+)